MKKGFNLSRLFNNNHFLQVLSLLIAIAAWLGVSIIIADNTSQSFEWIPVDIEMAMRGSTPESMHLTIIDAPQTTINVRVEGPRSKIGLLNPETDFQVTPVLTGVTEPGEQSVPIEVTLKDPTERDIVIKGYTSSIRVNFDRVTSKTLELQPEVSSVIAADGFKIDDSTVTVSPKTISLSGPQTELDQIRSCAVVYEGDPDTAVEDNQIQEGVLVFYDDKGNALSEVQLPHVTYPQQSYIVTIPVLMLKEVPVELSYMNSNGLDTSKLFAFIDYDTITVAGPKSVVEKREKISLDPIDVSKLDGRTFHLPVELNAGELNVDNITSVIVSFDQEDWDRTTLTIPADHIFPINTPAGYEVKVTSGSIQEVKLCGNAEDIELLSANDLIARVDLTDIDESTLRVRASIWVTGNKFAWAVGEYYVYIEASQVD